jgi:hypothetical protein
VHVTQLFETHYDQLKVLRSAPVEVIKASYRALSQKYHPDRNPDPDAVRRMTLINQAWDVLRDPEKRATHDRWIARQEQKAVPAEAPSPRPGPVGAGAWIDQYGMRLCVGVVVATALFFVVAHFRKPAQTIDELQATMAPSASSADSAPAVWPERPWEKVPAKRLPHGYLGSDVQYFSDGASSVEIDNSSGDIDADVRLYRNGRTVRSMFVHHGQKFVAEKLPAGTYTLKYKLAEGGRMHAYQANANFQLTQSGDEASAVKLNLSDVSGGTYEIPLDQI